MSEEFIWHKTIIEKEFKKRTGEVVPHEEWNAVFDLIKLQGNNNTLGIEQLFKDIEPVPTQITEIKKELHDYKISNDEAVSKKVNKDDYTAKITQLEEKNTTQDTEIQEIDTTVTNHSELLNTNKKNIEKLDNNKVDKVDGKGLSTNDFTNAYKHTVDNNGTKIAFFQDGTIPVANSNQLQGFTAAYYAKSHELFNKVDKEEGKELSTNDYTNPHKQIIDSFETEYEGDPAQDIKQTLTKHKAVIGVVHNQINELASKSVVSTEGVHDFRIQDSEGQYKDNTGWHAIKGSGGSGSEEWEEKHLPCTTTGLNLSNNTLQLSFTDNDFIKRKGYMYYCVGVYPTDTCSDIKRDFFYSNLFYTPLSYKMHDTIFVYTSTEFRQININMYKPTDLQMHLYRKKINSNVKSFVVNGVDSHMFKAMSLDAGSQDGFPAIRYYSNHGLQYRSNEESKYKSIPGMAAYSEELPGKIGEYAMKFGCIHDNNLNTVKLRTFAKPGNVQYSEGGVYIRPESFRFDGTFYKVEFYFAGGKRGNFVCTQNDLIVEFNDNDPETVDQVKTKGVFIDIDLIEDTIKPNDLINLNNRHFYVKAIERPTKTILLRTLVM